MDKNPIGEAMSTITLVILDQNELKKRCSEREPCVCGQLVQSFNDDYYYDSDGWHEVVESRKYGCNNPDCPNFLF
jgi:hypothetical protein